MAEIKDFGEKIGGAKKDLWKNRGLMLDDIIYFNDLEKEKYIKKDNIWLKPNYEELLQEGYSKNALFFIKTVRDSIPPKTMRGYSDTDDTYAEKQNAYIEFVNKMKNELLKIKTDNDIDNFGLDFFVKNGYVEKGSYRYSIISPADSFINNKLFKSVQSSSHRIYTEALNKNFLMNDYEIEAKGYEIFKIDKNASPKVYLEESRYNNGISIVIENGWSKSFMYPQEDNLKDISLYKDNTYILCKNNRIIFAGIDTKDRATQLQEGLINAALKLKSTIQEQTTEKKQRKQKLLPPQLENISCPDRRNGKNVTGTDYIEMFNFKGGEFGNWLNENDRQTSLNYGYDSFKDLAKALNIDDKDIAIGGLNIAFGARGSGSALAHYEIERNVINLTKMKGAGSLAHEWGHALDAYIGKEFGCKTFATEGSGRRPPEIINVIRSMKYRTNDDGAYAKTEFYENAIKCDKEFAKTDKGYWQSEIEMFARAFACYVSDKLPERNDYLTGHADFDKMIAPQGEERAAINKQFDALIDRMKELNLFHEPTVEKQLENKNEIVQTSLFDRLKEAEMEAKKQPSNNEKVNIERSL